MDIVFITDDHYAIATSVAIYSIKKNKNSNIKIMVHILCCNLSERNMNLLSSLNEDGFKVELKCLKQYPIVNIENKNIHVSQAALYKFDFANIFSDLDKILYLDGDILVLNDLEKLYKTDLKDCYAGVVEDIKPSTYAIPHLARLNCKNKKYFNSGMMLLNLRKIREDNLKEKFIDYRLNGINYFQDQDTLNVVFNDNVLYLPFTENAMLSVMGYFTESHIRKHYGLREDWSLKNYKQNTILHLCSKYKPWDYDNIPFANIWYQYFGELNTGEELQRKQLKQNEVEHQTFAQIPLEDVNCSDLPLISVIIPVYNAEQYLEKCINSIVSQKDKNIEIIAVDDGSDDSSLEILEEYSKKYSFIHVLHQQNKGAGIARNEGLNIAKGEYIHFMDSDDWLVDDGYKKFYECQTKFYADIYIYKYKTYDNVSYKLKEAKILGNMKKEEFGKVLDTHTDNRIFYSPVVPWNKIYRMSFIKKYDLIYTDFICANDRNFYIKALIYCTSTIINQECLLVHRINNDKSLVGVKRLDNFDVHFKSLLLALQDAKGCQEQVITAILDQGLKDIYNFYNNAVGVRRKKIFEQISLFVKKYRNLLEFDGMEKCVWWNLYKAALVWKDDTPEIIVSLTSYPERIDGVSKVVKSIIKQIMPPDRIILWLAEEQFSNGKRDLPEELLELENYGLEIEFCEDLKCHKKYFYTMINNPEAIVITVDDDENYPNDMTFLLYNSYINYPDCVSALRTHEITVDYQGKIRPYSRWNELCCDYIMKPNMRLMGTGVSGILYPPHCLPQETFNQEMIRKTCLYGDDLWLKAMEILNGVKTVLASKKYIDKLFHIGNSQNTALWISNKEKGQNDIQLSAILTYVRSICSLDIELIVSSERIERNTIDGYTFEELPEYIERLKQETRIEREKFKQRNNKAKELIEENRRIKKERDEYLTGLLETRKSITYKVGRFITALPRWIRQRIKDARRGL